MDNFFNWHRFDLPIKNIHLNLLNRNTSFGEEIYKEHLQLWNGFIEPDTPSKNTYNQFLSSFSTIYNDIQEGKFNWDQSPILLNKQDKLVNGAHRLVSALHMNQEPKFKRIHHKARAYDYQCFQKLGLAPNFMDAAALNLVTNNPDIRLVHIFPSAKGQDENLNLLLAKHIHIAYKKNVLLNANGAFQYTKELYQGEKWGGDSSNNHNGYRSKSQACFPNNQPLQVFFAEIPNLYDARKLKEEIREIYNIGNHSVHINDTYEETIRLSQILLNNNSITLLNNITFNQDNQLKESLQSFESLIPPKSPDEFCLVGDIAMSILGLKHATELQFIHNNKIHTISTQKQHNSGIETLIPEQKIHFTHSPDYPEKTPLDSHEIINQLTNTIKTSSTENSFSVIYLWKDNPAILKSLQTIGKIQHTIPVKLLNKGKYNLLEEIHSGKEWWTNNLISESDKRIPGNQFIAYTFTGSDLHKKVKKWKYDTRNFYELDKTHFHVSDPDCQEHIGQQCECPVSVEEYRAETIRQIHLIAHKNTLEFLNKRKRSTLPNFDKYLQDYINWLPNNHQAFCIDNGGVMGAFGIRDTHDIDFLCKDDFIDTKSDTFGCENKHHRIELERLGYSIEEIIDNPKNFFYHMGVKFMSLQILKEFKKNRTRVAGIGHPTIREKDKTDLRLIELFLKETAYFSSSLDEVVFNPDNHFYFGHFKVASIQTLLAHKTSEGKMADTALLETIKTETTEHQPHSNLRIYYQNLLHEVSLWYQNQKRVVRLIRFVKREGFFAVPSKVAHKIRRKFN